ncbi:MAG: phosphatidylinositol-specific phospholipase C/glycerophosphodiester phosphodiesterase family protein [Cytophagales bacterium]|nr:phosphatidylinositol-specific phospholipase C/glycerophosphodiester phosphodiesterase family protein [Cytophagales bacterium]
MRKSSISTILLGLIISANVSGQGMMLLRNGHSHNDYTRDRPLYDALNFGYTSIEVDVYLHNGRMVVTHDDTDLDEKPSLQDLYLDPLKSIIENNGGTVFEKDRTRLVLMIDLKSEKVSTYLALREICKNYLDIIERNENGKTVEGPVRLLLSGGPPIDLIEKEAERIFFVDGSIDQWSMDYPVSLMPRASANYRSYFRWHGNDKMPGAEEEKLRDLIRKAHSAGRKVRFWGCPNRPEVWEKLLDEGVDWINVDDLKGFRNFFMEYKD